MMFKWFTKKREHKSSMKTLLSMIDSCDRKHKLDKCYDILKGYEKLYGPRDDVSSLKYRILDRYKIVEEIERLEGCDDVVS